VAPASLALTTSLAKAPTELKLRRPGALAGMSTEERDAMLADAVAGKYVRLEVDATTYIQTAEPNRNFVRFKDSILSRLAKSFAGVPLLRDHKQNDSHARGGTVIDSKLVDHPGGKAFQMTFELTEPGIVADALRGLVDRFSIGWNPLAPLTCSVCKLDMFDWWAEEPCLHYPGDVVEVKGNKVVVEGVYQDAEGLELSSLSVPGVRGTEVQDIRAALAAVRTNPSARPTQEKTMSIRKQLGLGEDATDEQVAAKLEAIKASSDANAQLAAEARTAQATAEAQLTAVNASRHEAEVDLLILSATKRVGQVLGADGKPVETELTKSIRGVAKALGIKAAAEIVDRLPQVIPTTPPGALSSANTAATTGDQPAQLSPEFRERAKKIGVTPEQYAKSKARIDARMSGSK
jgi:hypothetical protein